MLSRLQQAAMQTSQPSTTAPRLEHDAPKLRSSCNGCGTAKVKCDRGQPQCTRCKTLNLSCVYERSRKHGKPPRKRPESTLGGNTDRERDIPTMATDSRNANEPTEANSTDRNTDMLSTFHSTQHEPNRFELTSAFYPLIPQDEWPQIDGFGASLDIFAASTIDPTFNLNISFGKDKSNTHSCPRESYEIFRDLICPTEFLHAPESNFDTVSAQFDQVLHFNRTAIERLTRILNCPCSKSGHRAMVHASSISRTLIWYQQAAGWPSTLPVSSPSCHVSSSQSPYSPSKTAADSGPPSQVQATGFTVEHVPLSVGTFNIEDQNMQTAFRNQLVLCELKRLANLIDLFSRQDSGEPAAIGLASLSSHLGSWLRGEHARTVRVLRSRLTALNESMGF
ncbi:uncharacterized protein LY89DRAFT_681014 [Mollisia scopiformis]|uniref:Zn(2)-C6 fungal-type domain-containing protein n=1 Tax=Mollisia scopiformis TaxID=149040 RepID=A0A194XN60_MOLSC|nr:uncharacterized protein LY89DRAFT_681014 [Mollisia scopiformis]KUJ21529.1 hypothetical protein LY89DRAFT_681014 [Mollisia scopiformis]